MASHCNWLHQYRVASITALPPECVANSSSKAAAISAPRLVLWAKKLPSRAPLSLLSLPSPRPSQHPRISAVREAAVQQEAAQLASLDRSRLSKALPLASGAASRSRCIPSYLSATRASYLDLTLIPSASGRPQHWRIAEAGWLYTVWRVDFGTVRDCVERPKSTSHSKLSKRSNPPAPEGLGSTDTKPSNLPFATDLQCSRRRLAAKEASLHEAAL